METYLLDWVNLLLRWTHVIVAIAWIGSSFYFVWLDNSLTPPEDDELRKKGVGGELWAVHGGGFYNPTKYLGVPPKLPKHLHWFYWESYSTWLSGFALFTALYLFNAGTFLIDRQVHDWTPVAASTTAIIFLTVFWLLYDAICRIFGRGRHGDAVVGAMIFCVIVVAAWAACQLYAGRAAFLLTGAMLATTMSANVYFWIIPGQRKVIASMQAGEPVDPVHGQRGKQRSVHNTYFTLPVLFAMLSNHYSFTYTHKYNWIVLLLIMLGGAAIRQFFVVRHRFKLGNAGNPLPYAMVGIVVLGLTIVWMKPEPVAAPVVSAAAPAVPFSDVQKVLEQRCFMCHGPAVQMKNVRVDSPEQVAAHAQAIYQQVVVTKIMPMNNATGITDEERALISRWFQAGAKTTN